AREDALDLGDRVGLELLVDAEAAAERAGEAALARRRADEREGLDRQADGARAEALVDRHVDHEVFHRAVEVLLDGDRKTVDLVEEEDVAALERREDPREVGGARERRPARRVEVRARFARDQRAERRLAESGKSRQQDVVERLLAHVRGRQRDAEVLDDARLADEFVEGAGPQFELGIVRPIQNGKAALARHSIPASLGPLPRGRGDRPRWSPLDAANVSVDPAPGKEAGAGAASESAPARRGAAARRKSGAAARLVAR